MPTLNRFTDILDLNKLTSSPMKMPMGVPTTEPYIKQTDIVAPCIQHQQDCPSSSPAILPRISSDSRHQRITLAREQYQQQQQQQQQMAPQRLSSSSSSSSSTPTSSFMAKGAPSSQSPRRHYRRVFSFLTKQPTSKDEPSTTTRQIKKKKSMVGTTSASWNMFKKSSNRSTPANQQQQQYTSSSGDGDGGVFVSADEPLVPGACTCTGPTTLKMDRAKQSYDTSTITTTTTTTAAAKHEHQYSGGGGGGFRSFPTLMSGDNGVPRRKSKKKMYDFTHWPCALVQDTIEQDRLVAQHYLLRTVFNGDHHAPVQSLLSQRQHPSIFGSSNKASADVTSISASVSSSLYSNHENNNNNNNNNNKSDNGPVVLDVGCGLGQWAMEMATTYPESTFIGIDILPIFPRDIKPRNCHFLQANVKRLPLPFTDHSIDFIYQRDLNWGLGQDDWYPLIKEYLRILKPGGWIELVEADLETKSSLEKECAMNDKLLEGFSKRRQDPYVARRLPSMLAVHGFRRVESHFQSLPLGWRNNNPSIDQGDGSPVTPGKQVQAMASQYLFYLRSLGPWLRLVMGISQSKYIDYVDQLPLEWEQAQTYVNWHCATAQKPYE